MSRSNHFIKSLEQGQVDACEMRCGWTLLIRVAEETNFIVNEPFLLCFQNVNVEASHSDD